MKRMNGTLRIAIYGKGGIGKSTVSANLSYCLSSRGNKLLQIGCDPKHDSTRALTGGNSQTTVLNALKNGDNVTLEDVVVRGACGIDCVECGGPEPGIGCAGRGIITTMSALDRMGLDTGRYDIVLYDVLGDVVCGGFAVPLRLEYSDVILVVTSGEFMSIYAANNILRGALNHNPDVPRIGGLVLNRKGMEGEDELVERFARAVDLPIVGRVSRDTLYAKGEAEGKTVSELFPDSNPSREFLSLADYVEGCRNGTMKLHKARPLDDDSLDALMKGQRIVAGNHGTGCTTRKQATSVEACAARGAVSAASEVIDLPIVIHGPRACGYNMANIRDVHFLSDSKTGSVFSTEFRDNILCTDMRDVDTIFGGTGKLKEMVRKLHSDGHRTVMVVTTCIPGIIGDDVRSWKSEMEEELEGLRILLIEADGNLTGDVRKGISEVRSHLVKLIRTDLETIPRTANLVATAGMGRKPDLNQIRDLLSHIGYSLRTVLFKDCKLKDIEMAGTAEMNIPLTGGDSSSDLALMLEEHGLKVLDDPIPMGLRETEAWMERLGNDSNHDDIGQYLEIHRKRYSDTLDRVRSRASGKRVYIAIRFGGTVDWAVEVLRDLGMEVIVVARFGRIGGPPLKDEGLAPMSVGISPIQLIEDVERTHPDLLLTDVNINAGSGIRHGTIKGGDIAIHASVALADYIGNILRAPVSDGKKVGQ